MVNKQTKRQNTKTLPSWIFLFLLGEKGHKYAHTNTLRLEFRIKLRAREKRMMGIFVELFYSI